MKARMSPWVWRLRPLGHPDRVSSNVKNSSLQCKKINSAQPQKTLAERSFDLRTSGLWAQHASTAPLCYHTNNMQILHFINTNQKKIWHGGLYWVEKSKKNCLWGKTFQKNFCQKWDSNPRPQKWTATWTQRLRPLGHPDIVVLEREFYLVRQC